MKIKKGLTFKMSLGYIMIAIVSIIVFVSSLLILTKNRKIDQEISGSIIPVIILYKDMNVLLSDIRRLSNSWVYTPNSNDKERLENILKNEYPSYKTRIIELQRATAIEAYKNELQQAVINFEDILNHVEELTSKLRNDEDYNADSLVDQALSLYEKKLVPATNETDQLLTSFILSSNSILKNMEHDKGSSYTMLFGSFLATLLFTITAGIVSLIISHKIIIKPINELKGVMNALGKGQIIELNENDSTDEISEMRKSIGYTLKGLKESAEFAVQIGKGNYDKQFTPLSEKDQMGNALIEMRQNLKYNTEEEQKRIWSAGGIAKISDILRKTNLEIGALCDEIIRFVVKYTESNQGGLFIAERNERNEEVLVLRACYAYERKKYVEKTIELGEGIVGQCYLEQQTVRMTKIPDQYFKITSGLGGATPKELIIVPLKLNENIFGVLELATFNKFEKYQVEFLEKICESIASSISAARTNERTKKLLEESQSQATMLREQEEEMRQNMEELTATQEEMSRKEKEYLARIRELEGRSGYLANSNGKTPANGQLVQG